MALTVQVVGRRCDLQNSANRLDPVVRPTRIDEGVHDGTGHCVERSSSAGAKNALALRRISLARFNSRCSRSNAVSRARSFVVTPGRWPASRSARRTHSHRVSGKHPICSAIDRNAADCGACAGCCSATRRTARSRTSAETGFGGRVLTPVLFVMLPDSRRWEPPQNSRRFTHGDAGG